jgi:hypothetical protein
MADVVAGIQWGRIGYAGWALAVLGAPAFLLLSWKLAFSGLDGMGPGEVLLMLGSAAAMAALAVAAWLYSRGSGFRNLASLAGLSLVAILLALSIRTGWIASFRNGDTPVEMIVYTQTSPDIVRTLRNVEKAGLDSGAQTTIPVTIDNTSGFTWPWAWYLRDYSKLSYSSFDDQPLPLVSNASVLLIHEKNRSPSVDRLSEIFGEGERIKHRWWFPESYRGLTLRKFLGALVDRRSWRSHMDYFLYRRLSQDIGSEDAYVYFAPST